MDYPNLPHAPIREAIVDLHVEAPTLQLDQLKALQYELAAEYPEAAERYQYQTTVDGTIRSTKAGQQLYALILHSSDRRTAVQLRVNGFAFSLLHP